MLIDLDHSAPKGSWDRHIIQSQLRIVSPTVVEGYRIITGWAKLRRVYFHIELSRQIVSFDMIDGDHHVSTASVVNGKALKAWVCTDDTDDTPLVVKVALSTTSIENARMNMEREASSWNFDEYTERADKQWEKLLSRIEVEGDCQDMQKFYTSLYHAFIQPNVMSDVNGDYTATDYSIRRVAQVKAWNGEAFPKDHRWSDDIITKDRW